MARFGSVRPVFLNNIGASWRAACSKIRLAFPIHLVMCVSAWQGWSLVARSSRWGAAQSSCRSGTRRDRRGSARSPGATTGGPQVCGAHRSSQCSFNQCCESGSDWIRNFFLDPDPEKNEQKQINNTIFLFLQCNVRYRRSFKVIAVG